MASATAVPSMKRAALEWVARREGLGMHEMVAVGDHYNDLEALLAAGVGVAVREAPPEVLAAAERVIGGPGTGGVADLDAANLRETLPKFFSTPHRLQQFEDALVEDPRNRKSACKDDIQFAQARREMAFVIDRMLKSGDIPIRTVHGDTKLNNVLFCDRTGRAQCIVDLDTCMPGYALYDFGDLVRFTAATTSEDEQDLDKVGTDLTLYRALVEGYLHGTRGSLSKGEIELMPFAARLVTYTIGLRFLADHLAGDVYFKVSRDNHNLDRARVQFRMVERMEEQADAMAVTSD
ncbi:MAG: phosphotransferase [Candidatus Poribacteria bacterium]